MNKPQSCTTRTLNESGNVLILILVAVILFGALAFALSDTSATAPGDVQQDKVALDASRIIQHANIIEVAVSRMLVSGKTQESLCFFAEQWADTDYNVSSCTESAFRIFHPNGGGVSYVPADPSWGIPGTAPEWLVTAANAFQGIGTTCTQASCADLILMLSPISEPLCYALNRQLDIMADAEDPFPLDSGADSTKFDGSIPATLTLLADETGGEVLRSKNAGCYLETGSDPNYVFYHVLTVR